MFEPFAEPRNQFQNPHFRATAAHVADDMQDPQTMAHFNDWPRKGSR